MPTIATASTICAPISPGAAAAGAALCPRATTLERLETRFAYAFDGKRLLSAGDRAACARATNCASGDATLRFVDQPHGGITSLGLRFDEGGSSVGYAIDFHDLTRRNGELYQGVDVWICDCLRRTPHPTHAHLDAVLGWARDLQVGQLYLTHIDNSMDYAHSGRRAARLGGAGVSTGRRSSL